MNYSNFSNFSSPSSFSPSPANQSAPTPSSLSSSPNATAPSPYSAISPSPLFRGPSPYSAISPSPENATFHRFNHSSSVSSIQQTEINFFIAYVVISFGVILIFLFFTRKHLHNLLVDSRQYVDVAAGDTELKRTRYGVLKSDGESKEYAAQLDEVEHKSRSVGEGVDI